MELSPSADHGAGCVDHREKTKYRIAGGVGTYTFGIIPWLAYVYLFPSWDWLIYLAGAQFVMSVVDVLALWAQFIFNFGPEFVLLRSHGLRHPGCGRTSAWDPIGGAMYLAQIIFKVNLGIPRGLWQFFVYDLPGWPIALIVNLPALLTGKFVFPLPF
ncbi:MAG: hypothetical protein AUK08_01635 [Candidatus Pacebacteria bacterium CG2_30_36_39]|nr:MAG: hypothetical protein AUK08_01635 [Candidatus Pacebacteria bacterium CG2_30_36_39]